MACKQPAHRMGLNPSCNACIAHLSRARGSGHRAKCSQMTCGKVPQAPTALFHAILAAKLLQPPSPRCPAVERAGAHASIRGAPIGRSSFCE